MSVYCKFTLSLSGYPESPFYVVRFTGKEALCRCYLFEFDLISKEKDLCLGDFLDSRVEFKIQYKDHIMVYNGVFQKLDQLAKIGDYVFYKALMVPRLWWLNMYYSNQVFLNKSVEEFLKEILKEGGLVEENFQFNLIEEYPKREFVCQYNETHMNFFQRWITREGIYYFFEQGSIDGKSSSMGEKVIIVDSKMSHKPFPLKDHLKFDSPSGLNTGKRDIVWDFSCEESRVMEGVLLKNYHYERPVGTVNGTFRVSEDGFGRFYNFGENISNEKEAEHLARIQAERIKCREKIYKGKSNIPYIRSGYLYNLEGHFRESFNQQYLITEVFHKGSQAAYLMSGLSIELIGIDKEDFYENEFKAIESSVQYRPPEHKDRPKIYGFINGKIDAEGDGKYAEIDEQGRYRVILPFDLKEKKGGRASCPVRMMQPYGGKREGMHFPLRKGTEVLLAFIDGDPDRPVIAGAVPNPETPSVVTEKNKTCPTIVSASGNMFSFNDKEKKEAVYISSPHKNSYLFMGSPEAQEDYGISVEEPFSVILSTSGNIFIKAKEGDIKIHSEQAKFDLYSAGDWLEVIGGASNHVVLGESGHLTMGLKTLVDIIGVIDILMGGKLHLALGYTFSVVMGEKTFNLLKMKFEVSKEELAGRIDSLRGEVNTLRGSCQRLEGNNTSLIGSVEKLGGQIQDLSASTNQLKGSVNSLKGNVNVLNSSANFLQAQINKLSGTSNKLEGTKTSVGSVETTTKGSHIII